MEGSNGYPHGSSNSISFPDLNFSFNGSDMPGPPPPPQSSTTLGFDFDFNVNSSMYPTGFNGGHSLGGEPGLLSSAEQTDLLGFLDTFEWAFDPKLPEGMPIFNANAPSAILNLHHGPLSMEVDHPQDSPEPQASDSTNQRLTSPQFQLHVAANASSPTPHAAITPVISLPSSDQSRNEEVSPRPAKRRKSSPTEAPNPTSASTLASRSVKPLLSQPQKRLNHIMSEQRRRNAIKDGYATIEQLVAPDPRYTGPPPSLHNIQGVKSKVRGSKGKGRGKGKMGTLFRAVEYVNFLEAGIAGLKLEVERLESAAREYQVNMMEAAAGVHGSHHINPRSQLKFSLSIE